LVRAKPKAAARKLPPRPQQACEKFVLRPSDPITITRLMSRLNESLDSKTVVIADVGDAMFAATELVVRERTEFIAPAYYTSMGFAVPAALGADVANPDLRVVAVVGDGAFQMTGMELSTIVRHGYAPIVIVLDNKGYGTERFLHPGDFNDINPWKYHELPNILGGGKGYEVRTEGEFDDALRAAWDDRSAMSLIQVHIGLEDRSTALDRLAQRLSKRV
jgi:indolepyruvate decarboxylase